LQGPLSRGSHVCFTILTGTVRPVDSTEPELCVVHLHIQFRYM
jgi:hypothetical protein